MNFVGNVKEKLPTLPEQPGCYLMKDKHGTVIYVGKAKILKNRVRSYFTGSHDGKTQRLVNEIADFEYVITSSELEALILEMNLIKKHEPKYNVLLKDDKSYPYLKITKETHPRLVITRKVKKDGAKYFGPYPNASAANETKKLLDRLYPLRKCRTLPKRVCLYYHIGQCLAPCEFEVSEEQNQELVQQILRFLNNGHHEVKKELEKKMEAAAEELDFERAKEYRDIIMNIDAVMEKQQMMVNDQVSRDVFGYTFDKGWMCVQVFFIRQGKLIERDVSIFPFYRDPEEDFLTFLGQFYSSEAHMKPKEVIIPSHIDTEMASHLLGMAVTQPKRGRKKEWIELAEKNAKQSLRERFFLIERDEERTVQAVEELGKILKIDVPHRIEAFDNSNIQGTNPVSAMVTFLDGKPEKSEYRKYKINTVSGVDDYKTMEEVIRRRYLRLLKEKLPLPDLILVDGGKGQLNVAKSVLEDELGLSIPVAGIVKDEKHRTSHLIIGEEAKAVHLKRNSNAFYLIQRIQDEVHRFAITFHRTRRKKSAFASILDEVPGIGEKRKKLLLRHFGSIHKIKEASEEELRKLSIPASVSKELLSRLQEED